MVDRRITKIVHHSAMPVDVRPRREAQPEGELPVDVRGYVERFATLAYDEGTAEGIKLWAPKGKTLKSVLNLRLEHEGAEPYQYSISVHTSTVEGCMRIVADVYPEIGDRLVNVVERVLDARGVSGQRVHRDMHYVMFDVPAAELPKLNGAGKGRLSYSALLHRGAA